MIATDAIKIDAISKKNNISQDSAGKEYMSWEDQALMSGASIFQVAAKSNNNNSEKDDKENSIGSCAQSVKNVNNYIAMSKQSSIVSNADTKISNAMMTKLKTQGNKSFQSITAEGEKIGGYTAENERLLGERQGIQFQIDNITGKGSDTTFSLNIFANTPSNAPSNPSIKQGSNKGRTLLSQNLAPQSPANRNDDSGKLNELNSQMGVINTAIAGNLSFISMSEQSNNSERAGIDALVREVEAHIENSQKTAMANSKVQSLTEKTSSIATTTGSAAMVVGNVTEKVGAMQIKGGNTTIAGGNTLISAGATDIILGTALLASPITQPVGARQIISGGVKKVTGGIQVTAGGLQVASGVTTTGIGKTISTVGKGATTIGTLGSVVSAASKKDIAGTLNAATKTINSVKDVKDQFATIKPGAKA